MLDIVSLDLMRANFWMMVATFFQWKCLFLSNPMFRTWSSLTYMKIGKSCCYCSIRFIFCSFSCSKLFLQKLQTMTIIQMLSQILAVSNVFGVFILQAHQIQWHVGIFKHNNRKKCRQCLSREIDLESENLHLQWHEYAMPYFKIPSNFNQPCKYRGYVLSVKLEFFESEHIRRQQNIALCL